MKTKPFEYWLKKNRYYHNQLLKFYKFLIPKGAAVLQVSCKDGYLLAGLVSSPSYCVDTSRTKRSRDKKNDYVFYETSLDALGLQTFDYILLTTEVLEEYDDIQDLLERLKHFVHEDLSTRIIVDTYSYLWEPVLWLAQKLKLRRPTVFKNWISQNDFDNFLHLAGYEVITRYRHILLPIYIPFISTFFNSFLIHVPLIRQLCLHRVSVARLIWNADLVTDKIIPEQLIEEKLEEIAVVSVVVPCKNEKGNIEEIVKRCPKMGEHTEIIFVEGGSTDGTFEEIKRVGELYSKPYFDIRGLKQDGKGKGNAVRKGFDAASWKDGSVLMILDADMTVPPEELPKFLRALLRSKGELINGSRLVYGMESDAMRFLNLLANYFFSVLFSWLLGQKVKDTLCGTKVLYKRDYEKIAQNRSYFGDFDPFGDFDLLFGAAKLHLKIIDMPVHYKRRIYGTTQIRRFYHGWILLFMSFVAMKKFKIR